MVIVVVGIISDLLSVVVVKVSLNSLELFFLRAPAYDHRQLLIAVLHNESLLSPSLLGAFQRILLCCNLVEVVEDTQLYSDHTPYVVRQTHQVLSAMECSKHDQPQRLPIRGSVFIW